MLKERSREFERFSITGHFLRWPGSLGHLRLVQLASMRFDWKTLKAGANRRKHRVSFEEACTIFADRSILTIHDEEHSTGEDRWVSMALSSAGRVLVVVHTWPEPDQLGDELVRIISARRADKQEQGVYLERKR